MGKDGCERWVSLAMANGRVLSKWGWDAAISIAVLGTDVTIAASGAWKIFQESEFIDEASVLDCRLIRRRTNVRHLRGSVQTIRWEERVFWADKHCAVYG